MFNYYRIQSPYAALVYAKNEDEALKIYDNEVCEKDDTTKCEHIGLGDIFAQLMLSGATVDEIRTDLSGDKAHILATDAALD